MLDIVDQILEDRQRTPAWLCRQAGVNRCNYSNIKAGRQQLSENMKYKFSKALGIRKEILFKNEPNNNKE